MIKHKMWTLKGNGEREKQEEKAMVEANRLEAKLDSTTTMAS